MENETEIWKSHPEYAGIEVSTFGKVRTLDMLVSSKGNGTRLMKGRILKPASNSRGYLTVAVKVNDKFITKTVHRLVAQTFIPNPDNLPQVNHKDCNRKNNNVDNLEFCTASYNAKYREKYGISRAEAKGRPVFAINLESLEVARFRSQIEASRELGVNNSNITAVTKGKRNHAGGYWFVNDDDNAADAIKQKLHEIEKTGLKIYS